MRTKRIMRGSPAISEEELHLLSDGLLGEKPQKESLKLFLLRGDDAKLMALWNEHKKYILGAWARECPGQRPALWWRYDAPEPARRRLGGVGDPACEHLAYKESYTKGIPDFWVSDFDTRYYNGRALDVDGNLIPCEWQEGDFTGKARDSENPPKFESEAEYLRRHKLFMPGEERRLKPADFEPEAVMPELEEEITIQ